MLRQQSWIHHTHASFTFDIIMLFFFQQSFGLIATLAVTIAAIAASIALVVLFGGFGGTC